MKGLARFHFPTEILFGAGGLPKLGEETVALGLRRPLLMSDPGVARAGWVDSAVSHLTKAGGEPVVFASIRSNPGQADCDAAVALCESHACDGLVALGGGSVIDCAKGTGALLALRRAGTPASLAELDCMAGGRDRMPRALPPLIAVATTPGTGSEISRAALLQLESPPRKVMLLSRALIPALAILDPQLCGSCPDALLAGTGMDALSHALEVYLAPKFHPPVDALALAALGQVARALPKAYSCNRGSPDRIDALSELMMGSMMAAMGFDKGVGLVHCLSHPLSALFGVHHGTANAVLLPTTLAFTAAAGKSAQRLAELGAVFAGAGLPADPIAAVVELNRTLHMPTTLSALGVTANRLGEAAALAVADPCRLTATARFRAADAEAMYKCCLG